MTYIERTARLVVKEAQERGGPQTVRFMVGQTNAEPSRALTDEVRRVLAVKRGWGLADNKMNGRQMWTYTKPKEGEAWGSGAEAAESVKSGQAERPHALHPDEAVVSTEGGGMRAACAETATLDIRMDPKMRKALKKAREHADDAKRDTMGFYDKGRRDGRSEGWVEGGMAGAALTLAFIFAAALVSALLGLAS